MCRRRLRSRDTGAEPMAAQHHGRYAALDGGPGRALVSADTLTGGRVALSDALSPGKIRLHAGPVPADQGERLESACRHRSFLPLLLPLYDPLAMRVAADHILGESESEIGV